MHLRLEVNEEIHKTNFKKFELFKSLGNKNFLAWVSSRLKQHLFAEQTYFYQKGDAIDNFYFSIKGIGGFVMTDSNNEIFSVIDPIMYVETKRK